MLRIRLVGDLVLCLDGRRLEPIASRRARSLLAWLAYHPGLHTRARVAAVFWPDVLDSSARASLRTTLAMLRRDLGEAAGAVVAGRDRLGIEDSADVWIDVREGERLAAQGRHAEALRLADGDLLTDLDDDWVLEARSAHRDRVVEWLGVVGDAAEEAGDLEAAVRHARRRLELDPLSEEAARALMRRLGRTGEGAAAVATYEEFRSALRRELGMTPSAETRALVDELRADGPVLGAAPAAPPLPSALGRSDEAPLAGRAEQLAALRAAWRQASAGAAGMAMVSGPAGAGKTRLLIELANEACAGGATVLAGRCKEDRIVAFAPFTEALRQYVAAAPDALPEWTRAELARLLPELAPEAIPVQGDPQDARHRLFEAVAATIGMAARHAPVLLVVEDLHWADDASLGMLAHVIHTVGWAPLLVAGSFRDEGDEAGLELRALLADLRRERRLEQVRLAGLPVDEADELIAAWLGEAPPPKLTQAVHERTGGNPLFIEELVRHLVETHAGKPVGELVEAAATDVPEGVRAVIDRRVALLPEPARRAVTVAAVIGEDFGLTDVAAASNGRDDDVAESLDAAVRAGLIDESQLAGQYRFSHALIRGALLAGLTATRRALLHRRVAQVLEALPERRREARLPELVRHLLDAGPLVEPGRVAALALHAAEQATGRLAYEEAAELLERVAATLDDADPVRPEILIALGDARLRLGDEASAGRSFRTAAELARGMGDDDLLARAALGAAGLTVNVGPVREDVRSLLEEALAGVPATSPLRPRLLGRLAIELYYARPASLRERLSKEALEAGRRAGGRALLEALGARHVALWSPAHAEERLRIADELIAAAREVSDREAELQGVNWRVTDLVELGDHSSARAAIAEHERLAGELRLLGYAWYVPMWRAMLALLAGRLEEAQRLSDEAERIGRAAQDANAALLLGVQQRAIRNAAGTLSDEDVAAVHEGAQTSPAGAAWRVWAAEIALVRGDRERARRVIRDEVEGLATLPLDANWLYTAAALGVGIAQLGDAAAAAVVYPELLPYGDRMVTAGRASFCAGSAHFSLGLLARTLGERRAAVEHLEEATRRNDALGARPYAAAARNALAEVVEDGALAASLRDEARAVADELGFDLRNTVLSRH
jgi:DNA-binding SARP family transcriptional activator